MDTQVSFTYFTVVGLGGAAALLLALWLALALARRAGRWLLRFWRRGRGYVTVQDVADGNAEYLG